MLTEISTGFWIKLYFEFEVQESVERFEGSKSKGWDAEGESVLGLIWIREKFMYIHQLLQQT